MRPPADNSFPSGPRGRKPWSGWPDEEVTVEKRRLNEGLRNLWDRSEVSDSDRHRFLSDIVGEPL